MPVASPLDSTQILRMQQENSAYFAPPLISQEMQAPSGYARERRSWRRCGESPVRSLRDHGVADDAERRPSPSVREFTSVRAAPFAARAPVVAVARKTHASSEREQKFTIMRLGAFLAAAIRRGCSRGMPPRCALLDRGADVLAEDARRQCSKNVAYMQSHRAGVRVRTGDERADRHGEPEQCAGWASNGECTRNPKYMLDTCPRNRPARARWSPASSTRRRAASTRRRRRRATTRVELRKQVRRLVQGSRTLRGRGRPARGPPRAPPRELKDDKEECAAKAKAEGCVWERIDAPRSSLRHCYLSCAEHDARRPPRGFRAKISARTRARLPRRGAAGGGRRAAERRAAAPLPCSGDAARTRGRPRRARARARRAVHRWRRLGVASCAAQPQSGLRTAARKTSTREASRATLRTPAPCSRCRGWGGAAACRCRRRWRRRGGTGGHAVRVLPIVKSPKVRLARSL